MSFHAAAVGIVDHQMVLWRAGEPAFEFASPVHLRQLILK
jgi:hypothetical protein